MRHLTPRQTHDFLRQSERALFVDCRSETEFMYVGHPVGAEHLAWQDGPDWEVNPRFAEQMRRLAGGSLDRPVVLICRSGQRSIEAGFCLEEAGFTDVINVLEGFEGPLDEHFHRGTLGGWRHAGLPWQQS